jgi:hypothetical protein
MQCTFKRFQLNIWNLYLHSVEVCEKDTQYLLIPTLNGPVQA